jgi:hypothetical protein
VRFLARFAMRGPFHAAAAAAATMLGALAVGLLVILSGAVVTLVTLRHGSRKGLEVIVLGATMAVAIRLATSDDALSMLVLCLVVWLPAWLMAINLGRTRRQAMPLVMIAVLVGAYALAIRFAVGDVAAFWELRLRSLFEALADDGGPSLNPEQVAFVAAQIHMWTLVAMFSMLAAIVFLGRWWQAVLYNPGGFGAEFREIELPRLGLPIALATGIAFVVERAAGMHLVFASDAFVIVMVLFAFQGLAVIHFRARAVALARGWLAGLYVMLMLTPQIVGPILATTGIADGFADFRRLASRRSKADE